MNFAVVCCYTALTAMMDYCMRFRRIDYLFLLPHNLFCNCSSSLSDFFDHLPFFHDFCFVLFSFKSFYSLERLIHSTNAAYFKNMQYALFYRFKLKIILFQMKFLKNEIDFCIFFLHITSIGDCCSFGINFFFVME